MACMQYTDFVLPVITLKLRFDEGTENLLLKYINSVNQNSSCYTNR